jgi:4-hydroxybenzoate polyprenyltransferase
MVATSLLYHLHTLLLFTKSDVKIVILPVVRNAYSPPCIPSLLTRYAGLFFHRQTLFAAAAAPSCSLTRLPHAVLWLWVHALHCALANQTLPHSVAEDALNHPDRPLPAGRISLRTACTLRWMIIPMCLLLSAAYGPRTLLASLCGSLYMLAYNDWGGARSHWLVRSALNAIGNGTALAGTTLVICTSHLRLARTSKGLTLPPSPPPRQ